MFHPGDIVTLKEPEDGDEETAIFLCYTSVYSDVDCVLIWLSEADSLLRYYYSDSDYYKLSPTNELYTKHTGTQRFTMNVLLYLLPSLLTDYSAK